MHARPRNLLIPLIAAAALLVTFATSNAHDAPPSVPDGLAAASSIHQDAPSGLGCGSGHVDVAPVSAEAAPAVVTVADNVCAAGGSARCETTARPDDFPASHLTRTWRHSTDATYRGGDGDGDELVQPTGAPPGLIRF